MRWRLSKPKREQIYQHLPLRVNYSSVSCRCCMCCMEKRSGIWVSLLSLGGPDRIISVNVNHVNIYADWLLLYAKPLKSCCQPLQQMFSCRHLSSVPLQSIIRAHGCEIMSAAVIFFQVRNVVVFFKGSIQLPSRVEIKNFACYLDQ